MKKINFYSAYYFALMTLTVVCMLLVYKYYSFVEVYQVLVEMISWDLAQFLSVILIWVILGFFFIIELVLFITSVTNKDSTKGTLKRMAIIIPIVFVFVAPFAFSIAFVSTPYTGVPFEKTRINARFEQLQQEHNEDADYEIYTICEKNVLGKAGMYQQKVYFDSLDFENEEATEYDSIEILCSYQQSDSKFLSDKFERYKENAYALQNKEERDGYTLYYEKDKYHTAYTLLICDKNTHYVSQYSAMNNEIFDSYSKTDFIEDSLEVYNFCNTY